MCYSLDIGPNQTLHGVRSVQLSIYILKMSRVHNTITIYNIQPQLQDPKLRSPGVYPPCGVGITRGPDTRSRVITNRRPRANSHKYL